MKTLLAISGKFPSGNNGFLPASKNVWTPDFGFLAGFFFPQPTRQPRNSRFLSFSFEEDRLELNQFTVAELVALQIKMKAKTVIMEFLFF